MGGPRARRIANQSGKPPDMNLYTLLAVNSVTLGQSGGEMTLNLAGIGSVSASSIQTIGK